MYKPVFQLRIEAIKVSKIPKGECADGEKKRAENEFLEHMNESIQNQLTHRVKLMDRFKGLDLVDKVPEELWMEVCNIAQEAVTKTIRKEKKCKKAKWLSEEDLQIAERRSERQGRKGKIYPTECIVPKNSKER